MKARTFYGRPPAMDATFNAKCLAVPRQAPTWTARMVCDLCHGAELVRLVADARWRTRGAATTEPVFACARCRASLLR